ncbi:MAG: hypothetical protein K2X81_18050, partial [Candidatus Obscuribacterales bacterium]|nr:hypothetical protein [Candidatus Obscuribacterales bacterium]
KILITLRELNSLITPSANSYLSSEQRIKLAEQAMHTVAHPRSTDQGSHNTCGATSAEVVLGAKYPERLVNLLNQIADSGEYHTAKGLWLKPSSQSLEADAEASSFDPYDAASEGVRSYVGQLVQTVGIDSIFAARNQAKIYESKDIREYVLRTDTGDVTSFDGLEDPDVHEMLRQLSGDDVEIYSKNKQFDSADSLQNVLNQLKQSNAFPVVFSVDILKQGPFLNQYREDRAGLDDGGHYVTIWDIDSNGNVQIDDQFGRAYDFESLRRVPVADLFESSMTLRAAPVPHMPFMVPKKARPGN